MSEEYEAERSTTREEAAAVLRDLADGVAAGSVRMDADGEQLEIAVPDDLEVELEFERTDDESELEVELEWRDSPEGGDAAADADSAEVVDEGTGSGERSDGASVSEDRPDETGGRLVEPGRRQESSARFEVFEDAAGEWRWRLVHRNGNVIATSGEGYTQKHNATKGLRSVVRNAPEAELTDE